MTNYLLPTYNKFSQKFIKGQGSVLLDDSGKKYLDFLSGIAVCNLGHSNPKLNNVLKNQAENLWHTSNLFNIEPQEILAKKLVESSFEGQVFFANSGAEANEGALKLARKFSREISPEKIEIVSFKNSFHGRTFWTLSITGKTDFGKNFEPLPTGRKILEFNNFEDLQYLENNHQKISTVIVEVIQGEGGVIVAKKTWLKKLREICDAKNIVLIFDEVQTGIGRTGKFWGFQNFNIKPDIFTFAKGLGNGFPIGGFLANYKVSKAFSFGDHGSTFGGNFLGTCIGIEVLNIITNQEFLNQVTIIGKFFKEELTKILQKFPEKNIKIRGEGLILGLTGNINAPEIVKKALNNPHTGFIFNATNTNTLRFLPPLIIKKEEINELIKFLEKIII